MHSVQSERFYLPIIISSHIAVFNKTTVDRVKGHTRQDDFLNTSTFLSLEQIFIRKHHHLIIEYKNRTLKKVSAERGCQLNGKDTNNALKNSRHKNATYITAWWLYTIPCVHERKNAKRLTSASAERKWKKTSWHFRDGEILFGNSFSRLTVARLYDNCRVLGVNSVLSETSDKNELYYKISVFDIFRFSTINTVFS